MTTTKYTASLYLSGGKPVATVTQVDVMGGGDNALIRPSSRDSGWVRAGKAVLHDSPQAARTALIRDLDALVAHASNIRSALWKKSIGEIG